jgi:hypothetical protein
MLDDKLSPVIIISCTIPTAEWLGSSRIPLPYACLAGKLSRIPEAKGLTSNKHHRACFGIFSPSGPRRSNRLSHSPSSPYMCKCLAKGVRCACYLYPGHVRISVECDFQKSEYCHLSDDSFKYWKPCLLRSSQPVQGIRSNATINFKGVSPNVIFWKFQKLEGTEYQHIHWWEMR